MRITDFTGTRTLFALFLRRDRLILPVWILAPVLLLILNATTFIAMGNRNQGLEIALTQFNNDPLITTVLGPVMSINLPGAIVWRTTSLLALTLGLGSILSMIRHTRTDEETGRGELIRAYVVGRHATLTAALLLSVLVNLMAGGLIALTIIVLGGEPVGSMLFGATMSAVGCFFAGIGALGIQLRENSGSARGIGIAGLSIGTLLAIMNNAGGGQTFLRWMTPMAWQRVISPFAGNHGWLLLYCAAFTAVPIIIAYLLSSRRDLGAGLLLPRSGPPEASPRFATPLALAWRLQRKSFFGWLIGTTLYIIVFAAISPGLSSAEGVSDWLTNLGGTDWTTEAGLGYIFISVGIYLISLIVAVYAIGAVLQLKKEETEGRTEMLLDKRISRIRWMNSHLIVAALGSAFLLLAMGIIGGLVYGFVAGDLVHEFWSICIMSVSKIPAVWTLLGLTALLYGVFPRITSLVWPVWLAFILLELAWETQIVNWSIMRFSPFSFTHYTINISNLPMTPLFLLVCLSVSLAGIGLLGFRKRDILTKA
jgi:ABC-2 type transport system permease protein